MKKILKKIPGTERLCVTCNSGKDVYYITQKGREPCFNLYRETDSGVELLQHGAPDPIGFNEIMMPKIRRSKRRGDA